MDERVTGIHLDLKYLMPRKTFLIEWVRSLPDRGINTILLEYEDKFPYRKYPFLRVPDAFTPDELRFLLETARKAGLRVIPLVQTLSHLEFALGHRELAHLREAPEIPTQLCPGNPDAVDFVKDLLRDILAFHEADELVHIGADEAWFLGNCARCSGRDKDTLWLEHTHEICAFVERQGKRPVVWDDFFWHAPDRLKDISDDRIICAWNYGVTDMGDDSGFARRIDLYVNAGREVICAPCCNWGVLFPRHATLENTAAHVNQARSRHLRGVINTAWACFLLPLPMFYMQLSATGAMMRGECREITPEWETAFLRREFGTDCDGVAEALRDLGELWEVPVAGLGRPLAPPLFGCMDMVLGYAGGQDERRRRGQFPFEFDAVDFDAIHRRKLELLKDRVDSADLFSGLDHFMETYPRSSAVLKELAERARKHQSESRLLAGMAKLKTLSMAVLDFSLRNRGDPFDLERGLTECGRDLRKCLAPFLESASVERLLRIIWHPQLSWLSSLTE